MKKLLYMPIIFVCATVFISCTVAQPSQSSQTTTHTIQEWMQVGDYDVFVHQIIDDGEIVDGKRLVYIEVEYANNRSAEELSCRRNQWYLYDNQGYSYEAESTDGVYENKDIQYLGGERFLSHNMKLRGWLVFAVPADPQLERFQFITGFLNTETADIIIGEKH